MTTITITGPASKVLALRHMPKKFQGEESQLSLTMDGGYGEWRFNYQVNEDELEDSAEEEVIDKLIKDWVGSLNKSDFDGILIQTETEENYEYCENSGPTRDKWQIIGGKSYGGDFVQMRDPFAHELKAAEKFCEARVEKSKPKASSPKSRALKK